MLCVRWTRYAMISSLRDQCEGERPRRKDMIDIEPLVDVHATTANYAVRKGSHPYAADKYLRNTLDSVITGPLRTADRLVKAKRRDVDSSTGANKPR